ncbi:MAG: putative chromatin associated protein KTI12, partial [Streblomastix strix]
MPLILVCGPPACGKTRVATALASYFASRGHETTIINEESLGATRNDIYCDSLGEAGHRAAIKSAVYRALASAANAKNSQMVGSSAPICICDSLNDVRGVRYELFCLARQFLTTYCLVYCRVPLIESYIWNGSESRQQGQYAPDLLIDLWSRFEVPNESNHWERPFFEVLPANADIYVENLLLGREREIDEAEIPQQTELQQNETKITEEDEIMEDWENEEDYYKRMRDRKGKRNKNEINLRDERMKWRNEGEDEIEEWKQGLHSIERLEEKRHNRLEEMKA